MPSAKDLGWALFDQIVAEAPMKDLNPWEADDRFHPDYETLSRLLGVPLALDASSQSGVPALALDVWVAYELRRAGFEPDRVWPRATAPRVLPADVKALVESLPLKLRADVQERIDKGLSGGTTSASANLLGKNYLKQVDVVMSSWQTGPELMISTKRMDSSFGKNAANRVEESYGDAKNLSLRHPQAALGFVYSLRSTAFDQEPETAAWLVDLLQKLGREDDAYDAVALVVPEWDLPTRGADGSEEEPAPMRPDDEVPMPDEEAPDVAADVLPNVRLRQDLVPDELSPARFFDIVIRTVLSNTPITLHRVARDRAAEGLTRQDTLRSPSYDRR